MPKGGIGLTAGMDARTHPLGNHVAHDAGPHRPVI